MTPPFFLVESEALVGSPQSITLSGDDGKHAVKVRRIETGEEIVLTDGVGNAVRGFVSEVGEKSLVVSVRESWSDDAPAVELTVVVGAIKGDRLESTIDALTELGVDRIVVWQSERSIVRLKSESLARVAQKLTKHVAEAAKQSRRTRIPILSIERDISAVADAVRDADVSLVLDMAARESLADLAVAMTDARSITVVIGPEGGLSDSELSSFAAAGAISATIGPTILRAGTAAVAATSWVLSATGRWSDGPLRPTVTN